MVEAPDILQLGENSDHFVLTYVKKGIYENLTPVWQLEGVEGRTSRLIRDLNLRELGDLCIGKRFSEGFGYILANPLGTSEMIEGQRKAIEELSDKNKLGTLDRLINSMYDFGFHKETVPKMCAWEFSLDVRIKAKIAVLGNLVRILSDLEQLADGSTAQPLREIGDYVTAVKNSDEYEWIPTTVERGNDHLRLTLDITEGVAGNMTKLRFKKSEYRPKIPCPEVLRHLGHRIKAGIVLMAPYKWGVDEALDKLFQHNKNLFEDVLSFLPALEFYRAALDYEAVLAEKQIPRTKGLVSPNGTDVQELRHPLTALKGKGCTPNDYSSGDKKRVLVITGANNGGKTFYSKAVGMSQLLFQRGLSVPAKSANLHLVYRVYTHFVNQDDPIHGEGRYRFELSRMKEILDSCCPRSLIIVDEPCGGTDPAKGMIQSSYFLEALVGTGAQVIFNTHYHDLAKMEADHPSIRNVHPDTKFEEGKLIYNYRMLDGHAGTSYALEMAQSMDLGRDALLSMAEKARSR